jgi:hypothetical protein
VNPARHIHISIYVDGHNAEVGLWCEDCLLPSVVRVPLKQLSELGVSDFGVMEACARCEGYEDEGDDDGEPDALVCG